MLSQLLWANTLSEQTEDFWEYCISELRAHSLMAPQVVSWKRVFCFDSWSWANAACWVDIDHFQIIWTKSKKPKAMFKAGFDVRGNTGNVNIHNATSVDVRWVRWETLHIEIRPMDLGRAELVRVRAQSAVLNIKRLTSIINLLTLLLITYQFINFDHNYSIFNLSSRSLDSLSFRLEDKQQWKRRKRLTWT